MEEYLLVNGKIKLSNTQLILNSSLITIIKEKIAPLIIILLLSSKIYDLYLKILLNPKTVHWLFLIVFSIFTLICLFWLYNSWVKMPWKQKLSIQNINRITKEINDSETELFIHFGNGKETILNFRTNEPYLNRFLEDLAKKTNFEIKER